MTVSGTYDFNATVPGKFDSIVRVNLIVTPKAIGTDNVTICDTELPYTWRGKAYNQAGTHRDTIIDGCEKEYILNLNVTNSYHHFATVKITVEDLPYTYNDTVFTESIVKGTYN